ncbi:MAG: helix-turn-helix domain-containing protein [Candidatus Paracaedibacteraceae bacterium]|nr:helix-turn-helix domain-containing protein [Candidatus Paracaedibacteraceae bacterium]
MSTNNRETNSSFPSEMKFINPTIRSNFAPIENWLGRAKEISWNAKGLYGRLRQFADVNGVAYPKLDTLARECGLEKRTAERALKELKDHKLIYAVKCRIKKTNSYLFLWHPWMEESVDSNLVESLKERPYNPKEINTTNMSHTTNIAPNLSSTQKTHTTNMLVSNTTNMSYLYNRRKEHIEKNMYVGTHTHSGENSFFKKRGNSFYMKRGYGEYISKKQDGTSSENDLDQIDKDCIICIMLNYKNN